MKPPINLYLATSTGCNVRCKTCPAGRVEPEPGGVMSLEMCERILDKAVAECRVLGVQLYHYNEPTLIGHMPQMIRACHDRDLPVFLSTNLVVWKNVPAILAEAPEMFLISVSGYTQEIYERSHKNGDIQAVKNNIFEVSKLRKSGTTVQVSWHKYRYNKHEEENMRTYANALGFQFVPYGTSIIPHDRAMKVWATGIDDPAGEDIIIPIKFAEKLCKDRKWWPCLLQQQVVAVNGNGELLLCSNFADNSNLRGDLFKTTFSDFINSRYSDPMCKACKSVGGHVYASQQYTRHQYSPLVLAEWLYRKLHLQGRSKKFTAWCTRNMYRFMRPSEKGGL